MELYEKVWIEREKLSTTEEKIVFDIIRELDSRRGFEGFWEGIDSDIKNEILEDLLEITSKNITNDEKNNP